MAAAMTAAVKTPWSFPIRVDQVGQGTGRRLVADEIQRAAIAAAVGLDSLEDLEAEVEVLPWGRDYEIKGSFHARASQTCGVTLDPLAVELSGRFSVKASENEPKEDRNPEMEIGLDTPDPPDLIENGQIDLAAYVVEHLALEVDPFPRKPGVEFEAPAAPQEPSPFAVLATLKRDKE
jgi:uncharacterized metal-binding protein YceD (DUF177 family)